MFKHDMYCSRSQWQPHQPGPVFCLLLGVSSDYAQPITGQVTEVTCPVIGRAQTELTTSKRQKMGPGLLLIARGGHCLCGLAGRWRITWQWDTTSTPMVHKMAWNRSTLNTDLAPGTSNRETKVYSRAWRHFLCSPSNRETKVYSRAWRHFLCSPKCPISQKIIEILTEFLW